MDGWVTLPDAAESFGVKHDRLRRAALEGRLKGQKIGPGRKGVWLVRPADVEQYLAETRKGPKPGTKRAEATPPTPEPRTARERKATGSANRRKG